MARGRAPVSGHQLELWLERPRRPAGRGWAPEVPSTKHMLDGQRRPRTYVADRTGVSRRVRDVLTAAGGLL